ncbi:hypothetical protein LCGC14_1019960 [marine sediment metagenome]|uniref:Uncharacterized protein n=1 Tax=marine sediment metagenome TaxID=412755 RepID=A0A0F9NJA7_9ZZZZ
MKLTQNKKNLTYSYNTIDIKEALYNKNLNLMLIVLKK